MNEQPRFTALGRLVSLVLVAGLIGLGGYMVWNRMANRPAAPGGATESAEAGGAPEVQEVKVEVPKLSPPAAFQFKDNIVPIEISEYAGYAGLIAANGGLDPTENSLFFKNHGFKVKLTISEDESWSELNEGKIAASVTTVDVLAVVRPAAPRGGAGADRVLARRRRRRRAHRHQADQSAQGQDHRVGAVHRGRLLHPVPGAGSGPADQPARQPRRGAESGSAERGLHRGRVRGGRSVPERRQVRTRTGWPAASPGNRRSRRSSAAAADRRTS